VDTLNINGVALRAEDADARRLAASLMGRARTAKKVAASRANAARATEARRGQSPSEETKAKLCAAQTARRERERAEREALGLADAPKRPRGRPKQ
jgi:hypothetical protein